MYDVEKDKFSRQGLEPSNSKMKEVSFEMLSILRKNTENQQRLIKAWPYLKQGNLTVFNNGSFHEYDLHLLYTTKVLVSVEVNFDFEDDIEETFDSEYYSKRYNGRENSSEVYYLSNKEYEYFVNQDSENLWYFSSEPRLFARTSGRHQPIKITSLQQLLDLMDSELINAVRNWKMSRENYDEFFDQLGTKHLHI